jgi:hypothetical protein
VGCLDRSIGARSDVWQPHVPDALVELAGRAPDRHYTRTDDFPGTEELAKAHAASVGAIIHSTYSADLSSKPDQDYEGPARPEDLIRLDQDPWIPFKIHAARPGKPGWSMRTCAVGPFWAVVSLREN